MQDRSFSLYQNEHYLRFYPGQAGQEIEFEYWYPVGKKNDLSGNPASQDSWVYYTSNNDNKDDYNLIKQGLFDHEAKPFFQDPLPLYQNLDSLIPTGPTLSATTSIQKMHDASSVLDNQTASRDYSKDSLKFARRLSRDFLVVLQNPSQPLVRQFLTSSLEVLNTQITLFQIKIVAEDKLLELIHAIIVDVWKVFSQKLSCSKNKKISKLTKESWDSVFTFKGFWKLASTVCEENDSQVHAFKPEDYLLHYSTEMTPILDHFFHQIVFLANRSLVLTFLLATKAGEESFRAGIATFHNFVFLAMFPELYEAYNHKRGIFIDECCGACKVCQSKIVTLETLSLIKKSQQEFSIFQSNIETQTYVTEGERASYNSLDILKTLSTPFKG